MYPVNAYRIRPASGSDAGWLNRLAAMDSQPRLTGRILVGEIDGQPVAAYSVDERRAVADPFRRTAQLVTHLRLRADALRAVEREPSLRRRLLAGIPLRQRIPARAAA